MKKSALYLVMVLVLVFVITVGGTYAYFTAVTNSSANAANTASYDYEVIYSGGEIIQGELGMTLSRTGGASSTVTIRMGDTSPLPEASLYLDITDIPNNRLVTDNSPWQKALKWEVEGYKNNTLVYSDSGDFLECSLAENATCVTGQKLYIVKNYQLAHTDTVFYIYLWLDAEIADNGVIGTYLKGNVAATTEHFTGIIN